MKQLYKILQVFFLVFLTMEVFSQNVPELMYYNFNAAGNQVNYASAPPTGTNPAILSGLTIGGTGQFSTAMQGVGTTNPSSTHRLNTNWVTSLPSTGWTISMWLNGIPSNTDLNYLFGDINASSFRCFMNGAAGAGNLLLRGGGLSDVVVSAVSGGPVVVHFVYTGTSIRVFKNGVLSGTPVTQPAVAVTGAGPFLVGGYGTTTYCMPGGSLMDEFRVYNRALSDAEVLATWNITLPGGPGGTLTGTVTNTFTGTPISGVTVTVNAMTPVTTNASGVYTKTGIPAGTATVNATLAGYMPYSGTALIVDGSTTTKNFTMTPTPAILNGTITNAANGAPIKGAKITVNGLTTYSIEGGTYSLQVFPGGSFPIAVSKAGFENFLSGNYTFTTGVTQTVNIALGEALNKPIQPFTATLNTPPTQVALAWGQPVGDYELIYDDGVKETTTVWAVEGNFNALKFTPLNYPATIKSGSINIGAQSDYPGGPVIGDLAPFQVQLYDATGTGGLPGNPIGDPVDVVPTVFGWNTFTLPSLVINSGSFYMVMIQGGNSSVAARLAVDNTATQLRSYSKFVTGSGPWVPADGNFMMRCVVNGLGGPIDAPTTLTGYQVFRLHPGEEATPLVWNSVAVTTASNTVDNSWPSLPDGAYRWAVKAQYTGNRWSDYIFSNILGKNWTTTVTVNVTLTCASDPLNGTIVTLENIAIPDTTYTGITDATGKVSFTNVWKGNYHLIVDRIFYDLYIQDVAIFGPSTFDVSPLHVKDPVTNLSVNGVTLESSWSPPRNKKLLFNETWASGNFTANGWTVDGGNWSVSTGTGHPAPSAMFNWSPEVMGYDQYITSKVLEGSAAPAHLFVYDLYLSNFGTSNLNTMAVEFWNGTTWVEVDSHANTGNIAWTTISVDVTPYQVNHTFKFRFHAAGEDSYDINNWNLDNIQLYGVDAVGGPNPCVYGYNFYLNDVLSGFTPDTTYNIPPGEVIYGNTYNACVEAVYGSGYSAKVCTTFTAKFLCPPTELTGTPIESTAYLTWEKPNCGGGHLVTWVYDDGTAENGVSINAGYQIMMGNKFPIDATTTGVLKSFDMYFSSTSSSSAQSCILYIYDIAENLIGQSAPFINTGAPYPSGVWVTVNVNDIPFTGPFYALVDYYISATPVKNYFMYDNSGPQVPPDGLAWTNYDGVFASAVDVFGYTPCTFLQRATAFVYDKKGHGGSTVVLDPTQKPQSVPQVVGAAINLGMDQTVVADVSPSAPMTSPPTLLGYNIWRDGDLVGYVPNPNTLEYYDYFLDPGVYSYEVTGYYDVAPIPPLNDNSMAAGPVEVTINYGVPIPFYEPWDNGTFTYHEWETEGGWVVSTGFGNPMPSADFQAFTSLLTNYSRSIESPTLSAAMYTCAKVYLDFDYKLLDRNATGDEKLTVELYTNGSWKKVEEFVNEGDVDWNSQHFELKGTMGKAFKIRFRANGENSIDMLHWYVDNIHVYAVCTPPTNLLVQDIADQDVYLSWTGPVCVSSTAFQIIWDDGTYESGLSSSSGERWFGNMFMLPSGGSGTLTSFDVFHYDGSSTGATQITIDVFDDTYTLIGTSAPIMQVPNVWQNIPVPNIDFSGTFYGMVHSDNTGTRPYWMGVDDNGPYAADDYGMRYDGSVWQTFGEYLGSPAVATIRANGYTNGKSANGFNILPGQNPFTGTPGNNTTELSNISGDTYSHIGSGVIMPNNPTASSLQGYDIWRSDDNQVTFNKINTSIVTDTTYVDMSVEYGLHYYYVTSVFIECTSDSSNIVMADVVTGIDPQVTSNFSIYPNPATEVVNIKSSDNITNIEIMNYLGQTVYTKQNVDNKTAKVNVTGLMNGVYFVKVTTTQGIRTVKITVSH